MLDSYVEKAEATGRISANKYLEKQIKKEGNRITELKKEAKDLQKIMKDALDSGQVKEGSEGWKEWQAQLNKINEEILNAQVNVKKLNKQIRETNWEIFDKNREAVDNVSDELEFLYGLLGDEDKFYDDKGKVTKSGITGLGILSSQYNVALKQHQSYAAEIKRLNKEIANDKYNQDLIDRRQELYEADRKAIESANKYKESIRDVVEKGIKAQIESMKELIDKYNDLMDAQKDEADYAKKVADAQENVNKIQKQLNAYRNDDTEEGATRRQKLRNDLKNAQENLAQTEEERRISQTKKMLSDLEEEYENVLNARLDNLDELVKAVINGVDKNANLIKTTIDTATKDIGYTLTDYTATIFNDSARGISDLASYFTNGDFVNKVTSIATAVSNIDAYYKTAQATAEGKSTGSSGSSSSSSSSSASAKVTTTKTQKQKDEEAMQRAREAQAKALERDNKARTEKANLDAAMKRYQKENVTGWRKVNGDWYYIKNGKPVKGWQQLTRGGVKAWYYFDSNGVMQADKWINKSSKKGTYYVDANGRMLANGKFKTKDGYRTFNKDGSWKGYKLGTRSVPTEGLYWTNEGAPETIIRKSDGAVLTKLNVGDTVLNNGATQNMWDFANNPEKFLRNLGVNNTYGNGDVNMTFNLSGLKSPAEFMNALRKDSRFERFIQEITLGRVSGHGSLAKNAIAI